MRLCNTVMTPSIISRLPHDPKMMVVLLVSDSAPFPFPSLVSLSMEIGDGINRIYTREL